METTAQILKQDALGRVWTPRAQREAILDEFERSGLPATRFAAQIGVKYQTFVGWVAKRRKARLRAGEPAASVAVPGGWIEAMVASSTVQVEEALVVHLPGGTRLEVKHAGQVRLAAQLLRALEEGGPRC